MKLASKILGAIVIVMLVVSTVLVFVVANTIVKNAAASISNGNGDAVDLIAGTIAAVTAMLGYAGFILMNALGVVMTLYLICFCVSYAKLYSKRSNTAFIRYSALSCGLILFFAIILFACKPFAGWQSFSVVLLTSIVMIMYAVVAIKYLKNADAYDKKNQQNDAPPVFDGGDTYYNNGDENYLKSEENDYF